MLVPAGGAASSVSRHMLPTVQENMHTLEFGDAVLCYTVLILENTAQFLTNNFHARLTLCFV